MKRLLITLFAITIATSVSAQWTNGTFEWSAGIRAGSGIQAVYREGDSKNYFEARFGAAWINRSEIHKNKTPITADLTMLYNWKVLKLDWTPTKGSWYLDTGVGINVGGRERFAYVGLAAMTRLSFSFNEYPITIGIDYTPIIGPSINYIKKTRWVYYNYYSLANFAITCTYRF